ncbi:MAG: hypothetical protein Fur0043_27990 [Anaerolineales bacterium]
MKRALILLAATMLILSACAPVGVPTSAPTTNVALLPTDTPASTSVALLPTDTLAPTDTPMSTSTFTAPPTPTMDVTIRADLTRPGSPLSALLKPSANLHPMWGDRNQAPITWWQAQVPRWQEGTYFFILDLWHIENGDMNLAQGRYPEALVRFAGPQANTFIGIERIPASLEPPECQQDDPEHPRWAGQCAPTNYEAYQRVLEALITYLSVPGVVMPNSQATQILGIAGRPSLGLDGLHYNFWHEINSGQWNWRDGPATWFRLYDYWIAAVRAVRARYPQVHFRVGTMFQGDTFEDSYTGPQETHSELLAFLQNLFLPFVNGRASERMPDYVYRAEPPLDLEFYALNPRRNENHFWLNDWDDSDADGQGFYAELQGVFSAAGFGDIEYVNWALQSNHVQVEAPLLPNPPPRKPEVRYWGAERDSEMGAAAQAALQYEVARSPVIPISYSWAEWLSDVNESVNKDIAWDFPLYHGATGNAFTYAYYAKPTYNVMRMLGMQETIRLTADIADGVSPPRRSYVGAIVTRDETGRHIVVLLWYYIPPEDLETAAGRRYEDLRAYANTRLPIDLEVVLEGLGEGLYRLERYLVDETHSNGFHYRQQIADAKVPAEVANGWLPSNNPYGASVALEQVEGRDGVSPEGGTLSLRYEGVAPWTVMLIDLRKGE